MTDQFDVNLMYKNPLLTQGLLESVYSMASIISRFQLHSITFEEIKGYW
jgi:hypothetical protein